MTIWLAISNSTNWEIIKTTKIWGVSKRHKNAIDKVMLKDKIIVYSQIRKGNNRSPEITGIYEVISPVYEDSTKIFIPPKNWGDESFPFRVKLKPIKIFKIPILFESLIEKLNFITNKKNWGGHLQGKAMRMIPEEDYETIFSIQS